MAPLPENATNRLWLDYTSRGVEHSCLVRLGASAAPSNTQVFAAELATALSTRMFTDDDIVGARFSAAGTNFSLPISFTPVAGVVTLAGNMWAQDPESTMLSIPGHSNSSFRKCIFQFFTAVSTTSWPVDNRYQPGDAAPVDTWRTNVVSVLLGGEGIGVQAVAIDGLTPTWYNYVNISQNAYWQRKQRRTGG